MADYRLSAKVIGRSSGRSSVAAAAYRAGERLEDERTGLDHDYTRKGGVLHSQILAPNNAPDWMKDRAKLWNAVEAIENRKDSQLAREIQLSLPHELTHDQNRELVLSFVQSRFVDTGMIADVAIHAPDRQGDQRNIHAHVMLTMRELMGDGFGKKNREWNSPDQLNAWREQWADHQNRRFAELGIDAHVDHRSYEERGIDKEPQQHLGSVANDMERKGMSSRIGDENRERQQRNAERAELAQEAAKLTRALAAEQTRQEKRININLAAVQNRRFADLQEISIRHHRQKSLLDEDIEKRNGARRREYEAEQSRLQQQLQATGLRKLMRDMLGKTQRDQSQLEAHRKTLENMNMREAEQRGALEARNKAEKQEYLDRRNQWEAANLQRLEAERTAALQAVREAGQAAQVKTPADDKQPSEWQRQASTEQDNHGNGWAAFKEATMSKETDTEINGLFDRAAQKQDELSKGWAAFKEARGISQKDQTEASKTQSRGRGRGMDVS